ncbi:uncharacterized protein LOC106069882 [Biomphalaria glabrata]|uniref:Uncharacterized protein LOC106069882 n=1 Tax=Biomphalaria glabrata TaxID=6526 RepID=A0A9W2YDW6_BIOGL|nr:uncharacterized protein LOC106069882 [Biomphalaria glabrata]XP_055860917.1 uncharacterized protein LOC106069882 [Biomphalaria glabrata]KAI8767655.1 hypothetical protein BgiBS90_028961 [Biomphalaria glabrata]
MVFILLLLVSLEFVSNGNTQSLPQLNFQFVTLNPLEEGLDVHLEEELDHILFSFMCKFSGNKFTVRISPSQGATNLIDDSLGFTNKTEGAVPCLLGDTPAPITCNDPSFCQLGNTCRATVRSVCEKYQDRNRWMMTQAVDITLDQEDGEILVTKCFTVCEPTSEEVEIKAKEYGISVVTLTIIVVSVMVTPVCVVTALVLGKLKYASYLKDIEKKRSQMVH